MDDTKPTDALSRRERQVLLENWDKQQDQQRLMAWIAMGSMVILTVALVLPILSPERIEALSGLMAMFYTAQMGVVGAFMGASAYVRTRSTLPPMEPEDYR